MATAKKTRTRGARAKKETAVADDEEARDAGFLRTPGPGLITGASDDDPSGIGTYSQAGAQLGFSVSWTMLFSFPLMVAIQEISARLGRTTGRGIGGDICRHYPRPLVHGIVAACREHDKFRSRSGRYGRRLGNADRWLGQGLCGALRYLLHRRTDISSIRALRPGIEVA